MTGFWIFKLSSQKSVVFSRYLLTLSCCKSPRNFLSPCLSNLSPTLTLTPRVGSVAIHERAKHWVCVRRFVSHQNSKQPIQEGNGVSDAVEAHPHHPHTTTILQRLHDLEESFRVRGHSVLRWGLMALVVAGFAIYIFREPLRENVADEVADVASRSLGKSSPFKIELLAPSSYKS